MNSVENNDPQPIYGKEPWLAVNLSMFFPGIGQIYAGNTLRGWVLISIQVLLTAIGVYFVVSTQGNISIGLICLLATIPFFIWNLFDAYKCAKTKNSSDFEKLRKRSKDPWLAVFLSRIILGLGDIYLKKYFFGFCLVIFIISSSFITLKSPFVVLLLLIFYFLFPFIIYNTYITSPTKRENNKKTILTIAILALVAPLALSFFSALGIRVFIAEARYIPAESMIPTLQLNDRIIVNKLTYRFSLPQRGDLILFTPTESLQQQGFQDAFIKRVVGLPGERIEVKEAQVYINNQPVTSSHTSLSSKCGLPNITIGHFSPAPLI